MIDKDFKQESGKHTSMYRGVVVDVTDPLQLGRIKVKVFELMSDITEDQYVSIPWAVPAMAIGPGAAAGSGVFTVPAVGSHVFVFFEGNKFTQPVYFASAPDGVRGIPSFSTTNYPARRGVKFPDGTHMFVDTTSGLCEIQHKTGTIVRITATGEITVTTVENATMTIDGNVSITATGTGTIQTAGALNIQSATSITLSAPIVSTNP